MIHIAWHATVNIVYRTQTDKCTVFAACLYTQYNVNSGYKMILSDDLDDAAQKAVAVARIVQEAAQVSNAITVTVTVTLPLLLLLYNSNSDTL